MDPIIEEGYTRLLETLEELQAKKEESASKVQENAGALLARMAADTAPVVGRMGLDMLRRAKREASGELYDQEYYEKKMIVLGKTDPLPYRPDDPSKPIDTQICVLGEDGNLFEVMYTTTEIRIDSYLAPLAPEEAFDLYGYDVVVMLYRALYEYAEKEEELTAALARTLEYIIS
ncbi:MAG: hypothetical protein BWX50_00096 [Euryarchaeota archaeon ADurb.Bin009]|jgi:hypothetical protein|uniref:hypothetical protein n=1 Tax=Methanoculleus sp. TaxID=90427 RepID=UPI0009CE049A|nr:hypothetical protein [Methanoculleus sp.]MBP7145066.1 hypothetical protein [Methanoculleus sp.]OQC71964.1 MAG: hypothetical protein BWX50_00096 [Euryarchaeota archaeon ADurb.Bin009]HPM54168.1 hypothetical protein [Methanoculleus sp.]HQL59841.1 hypothetical protein [Methanoculleus sp.]